MTTSPTPPAASPGNKTAEVVARLQAALDAAKDFDPDHSAAFKTCLVYRKLENECSPAAIQTLLTALREQEETIASLRAAAGSNQ